jgi:hypothetical protein
VIRHESQIDKGPENTDDDVTGWMAAQKTLPKTLVTELLNATTDEKAHRLVRRLNVHELAIVSDRLRTLECCLPNGTPKASVTWLERARRAIAKRRSAMRLEDFRKSIKLARERYIRPPVRAVVRSAPRAPRARRVVRTAVKTLGGDSGDSPPPEPPSAWLCDRLLQEGGES